MNIFDTVWPCLIMLSFCSLTVIKPTVNGDSEIIGVTACPHHRLHPPNSQTHHLQQKIQGHPQNLLSLQAWEPHDHLIWQRHSARLVWVVDGLEDHKVRHLLLLIQDHVDCSDQIRHHLVEAKIS